MLVFLIRRSLRSIVALIAMSLLVFGGVYAVGNPIDILINPRAGPIARERAIAALRLGRPLHEQFLAFLQRAAQGDLGESFVHSTPALHLILERMPETLELALAAMLIAIVLGVPLGLSAGLKPETFGGRTITAGSMLAFSLPTFWGGLILIMVFSVILGWLPPSGRGPTVNLLGMPVSFLSIDGLAHLAMPATNLALFGVAVLIRLTRALTQDALRQDFTKFARAMGLSDARVIGVHVLRNALIPIVAVIGLQFVCLLGLAIVTENVFAWPGMGKLLVDSIRMLDGPVIVAYLLVIVTVFILINLLADILHSVLDPRLATVRDEGGASR